MAARFGAWFAIALLVFGSATVIASPEVMVVYWGSRDCPWCTYWESSLSGMEKRFRESAEFKSIVYRVVKNARLADPYGPADFHPDVRWIYDGIAAHSWRAPKIRPTWWLLVDHKLVKTYVGTARWDGEYFPDIKSLVAFYSGRGPAPTAEGENELAELRTELVSPWLVSVEGETRKRALVIRSVLPGASHRYLLDASYGYTNGTSAPINAEVAAAADGGMRITLVTPAKTRIDAELAADGAFNGTFTTTSATRRVRIERTTADALRRQAP